MRKHLPVPGDEDMVSPVAALYGVLCATAGRELQDLPEPHLFCCQVCGTLQTMELNMRAVTKENRAR